ncbi:phosphoserine aminotransferase [Magnaporthiopsis poae ATCC 64411]|uniref:phosphoserine transaminase n=1 Tax=Magnaporthiopsis poae (strain ATCC 64411 / 73-15) TaxID=644358 RepID=A0A0C4E8J9_MAGP6|nr:phosphoserine aminotransferase [Magnaporthiopsis poae ATCC 64411]
MPSRADITYFGAGPAALPTDVLERAAQALVDYKDTGLGIAEHSHRSDLAAGIIYEAEADLTSFLDLPSKKEHHVLFMQAGGTGEFAAVVYNLVGSWVERQMFDAVQSGELARGAPEDVVAEVLRPRLAGLKVDYIITGRWSLKAYEEAERLLGPEHVNVAADARTASPDGKFGSIPDESTWKLSDDAAFVYYCDNETVDGVEFPAFPDSLRPREDGEGFPIVVADMSSNILSRRIDIRNFSVVFFGAQKNLGSTGVTVAIVKHRLLSRPSPSLLRRLGLPVGPRVLSYETICRHGSLYNTLSIFDVYIAGQVLKKLLATYPTDKIDGQEAVSAKKAALIYGALDAHPAIYRVVPDAAVRSRMNICFRVTKNGIDERGSEKEFLDQATARGLLGLKGHRMVGGIRASNYNSITLEGAQKLAAFIEEFAKA